MSGHRMTERRRLLLALAGGAAGLPMTAGAASGSQQSPSQSQPPSPSHSQQHSQQQHSPLPLPPAGQWQFGVHYGGYERGLKVAVLDYEIAVHGGRYRIDSRGRAEGFAALVYSGALTQESEGRLTPRGLEPLRYREQRGKRPERWAELDRRAREVRFSSHPPVPLVDGVQDRLSVLIQLGLLARAHPERFAEGRVVALPELGSRRIEDSRYASRGQATLATPSGGRRTLHLERIAPRDADDARVDVWLGYDLDMLPVRLRFTDPDGRVLDQLLRFP
ncbi:MAG: DUF3108 domain-containing protein [Gammaproteobacteria bacterium]